MCLFYFILHQDKLHVGNVQENNQLRTVFRLSFADLQFWPDEYNMSDV